MVVRFEVKSHARSNYLHDGFAVTSCSLSKKDTRHSRADFRLSVLTLMTVSAQGNQVQIVVVALLAAQFLVVDLQVLPGTTDLASPAIAPQYLFSQLVVRFGIKPQARSLGSNSASRSLLGHFVQKSLPLFARKKFEEP